MRKIFYFIPAILLVCFVLASTAPATHTQSKLSPPGTADVFDKLNAKKFPEPQIIDYSELLDHIRQYFSEHQASIILDEISKSIERRLSYADQETKEIAKKYIAKRIRRLKLVRSIKATYKKWVLVIFICIFSTLIASVFITVWVWLVESAFPYWTFISFIILCTSFLIIVNTFSVDGRRNKNGVFIKRINSELKLRHYVSHEVAHETGTHAYPATETFAELRLLEEGLVKPNNEILLLFKKYSLIGIQQILMKKAKEETGDLAELLIMANFEPAWSYPYSKWLAHVIYYITDGDFDQAYKMVDYLTSSKPLLHTYINTAGNKERLSERLFVADETLPASL